MKKIILILFVSVYCHADRAEVKDLDKKSDKILFNIIMDEKKEGENLKITAQFKTPDGEIALDEVGLINAKTAEMIDYTIDRRQSKEKGSVQVTDKKVKIRYEVEGQPAKEKEFDRPKRLVAPANFEHWLTVHFEELKKEKSMNIDFLVWDRMETIGFKVTYLGEGEINKQKVHKFKMNIDNFFLSALISPIKIWKSEDMTQMLRYEGRVAVKQGKSPDLKNLDAEVVYFHDVKAAQ